MEKLLGEVLIGGKLDPDSLAYSCHLFGTEKFRDLLLTTINKSTTYSPGLYMLLETFITVYHSNTKLVSPLLQWAKKHRSSAAASGRATLLSAPQQRPKITLPLDIDTRSLELPLRFMRWPAASLAKHLTLITAYDLAHLELTELHGLAWQGKLRHQRARNVSHLARRFNALSVFVSYSILSVGLFRPDLDAAPVISYWLNVAKFLQEPPVCNFQSLYAIYSGLSRQAIERLKNVWLGVPKADVQKMHQLSEFFDPIQKFQLYHERIRELKKEMQPGFPVLPFILTELAHIDEMPSKMEDGSINVAKLRALGDTMRFIASVKSNASQIYTQSIKEPVINFLLAIDYVELSEDALYDVSVNIFPVGSPTGSSRGTTSVEQLAQMQLPALKLLISGIKGRRSSFNVSSDSLERTSSDWHSSTRVASPLKVVKRKPVQMWDSDDIVLWLKSLGVLPVVAEQFVKHGVDGEVLCQLTEADLRQIGVRSLGHRKKILRETRVLVEGSVSASSESEEDVGEEQQPPPSQNEQQKKQKKRLEQVQQLLEDVPSPVIVTKDDETITFVNDAATRIFGYSVAELLGHNINILESGTNRLPLRCKNGFRIAVETTMENVCLGDECFHIRNYVVAQEKTIRHVRDLLPFMENLSLAALTVEASSGRIRHDNAASRRFFGRASGESLAGLAMDDLLVHEVDKLAFRKWIANNARVGSHWDVLMTKSGASGKHIPVQLALSPMPLVHGGPALIHAVIIPK